MYRLPSRRWIALAGAILGAMLPAAPLAADEADRIRVRNPGPFEFAEKPRVEREQERFTIRFAVRTACDATVAIEHADRGIVRHLASGMLGANAPAPFRKDALAQSLVWDGKDDAGRYVDDLAACRVRVSLGLRPTFEKTLFHSPHKRYGRGTILLESSPEGVFVYDRHGHETVRLFDHAGGYVKTVYPFPADKIAEVVDLPSFEYPDGSRSPKKRDYFLSTLLEGRQNGNVESTIVISSEATGLAVGGRQIALAGLRLNRLDIEGGSGGLPAHGPHVDVEPREFPTPKTPRSLAFSPDGKWLYLSGMAWLHPRGWAPVSDVHWRHAVWRMEYGSQEPPQVFLGDPAKAGGGDAHFSHPADVAVDAAGRVYVADHLNDRVAIFDAEGKPLKSLAVPGAARVEIDGRTGQVYVFSWYMAPHFGNAFPQERKVDPQVRRFAPFPGMEPQGEATLPLKNHGSQPVWSRAVGWQYEVAVDCWADEPTIWLIDDFGAYPKLFRWTEGELALIRDFHVDARRSGVRLVPPSHGRQRLYVDPLRGHLYLGEGGVATGKAFNSIVRIVPETGDCEDVPLPFGSSDMAFSPDGMAHLRTGTLVGRFDPVTWREIPFDYGEEEVAAYSYDTRSATLQGALMLPSTKTQPHWHHGGMDINARGDLLVTCFNPASAQIELRKEEGKDVREKAVAYRPRLYPGRYAGGRELHVWDRHGKLKLADLIPGHPELVAGVGLDIHNNVYANISVSMMWPPDSPRDRQQPYSKLVGHRFDPVGTLVKFRPDRGRLLAAPGPATPVALGDPPARSPELNGIWIDEAEWIYPGVGRVNWGMDCTCWNSRIVLDYFARTFAPEYDRCTIAVLDTAGNLVARIGTYGNVEGREDGDRVTLFDGSFVATQTDRRLFIADPGNARIVSVKLDYHASETIPLTERDRVPPAIDRP